MVKKIGGILIFVCISIISIAHPKINGSSPLSITADFTSIINGTNVSCNASVNSTVVPVQFQWDWGNGDSSDFIAQNYASHQYAAAGTYTIRLIVVNSLGERDTVIKNVILFDNVPTNITPGFYYSPTTIFAGNSVIFTDTSTIGSGTISDWYWSIDGGLSFLTGRTATFTFGAPGMYIMLHTVYSSIGEVDTISKLINVLPTSGLLANFSYSPDTLRVGETIQFVNTSTISSGSIVNYLWNFGDGMNSFVSNPVHVYPATGIYTVSLTVSSSLGETDAVTKAIMVYPPAGEQKIELCPAGDSTELFCYSYSNSYQWQLSTDSGTTFTNISNNSNYVGTGLRSLQIKNVPSAWAGYKYRCVADSTADVVYRLSFSNRFAGFSDNAWENPGNWTCGGLPDANTDIVIPSGTTVVLNSNASCGTITVSPGASFTISPGYTLTITH